MAYAQGSVVLAPATFRSGVRPYLVVSNEQRPFFGDRYTVAVVTSREREQAVRSSKRHSRRADSKRIRVSRAHGRYTWSRTARYRSASPRSTHRRWRWSPSGSGN